MYFIRQLIQDQWVRTQHNLQNECMVKTDQTARMSRLMSIFAFSSYGIFIHFKQYMFMSNIYTKRIYKLYAYKSTNDFNGLQYKYWWDRENTHTILYRKKFQHNAILPHKTNNIYKHYELATWKSVLILKAFSISKLKNLITMKLVLDINSLSFT